MTVITKPLTDKKANQQTEPLVDTGKPQSKAGNQDVETGGEDPRYTVVRPRARRASRSVSLCLFMTAIMIMSIGLVGGIMMYHQFSRHNLSRFHNWCNLPLKYFTNGRVQAGPLSDIPDIDFSNDRFGGKNNAQQSLEIFTGNVKNRFRQDFEFDLENDNLEKIEIPNLGGNRKGRFIHDFNSNKTSIIDVNGKRCFIMELNRERVYPPRRMSDLIKKMMDGFYEVDMELVRENMEVVVPPINDFKDIGPYIERECKHRTTYMLKKRGEKIVKRSAPKRGLVFTEFAGSKISELDIDITPAEEFEKLSNA